MPNRYGPPPALLARFANAGVDNGGQWGPPNDACHCASLEMAMFCQTGHMVECHYPLSCKEAKCSHYQESQMEETDR